MITYETCKRCYGRGYKPEKRRASKRNPAANGFYARTCPVCGGSGSLRKEIPDPERKAGK